MRLMLKILASLLIAGLLCAWYLGVFSSLNIEDKTEGGFTAAGLEFTGPYSKAGKHMKEVDEKLKNAGITSLRGFGIYYDDPKTTPPEKCRSFIGTVLEEKELDKISRLRSVGFKVDSIPLSEAVVTTFPAKSSLSYMIGPMKVYPAMSKYLEKKKYKVTRSLEVYDMPAKKITYIMQYETQTREDEPIVVDPAGH